MTTGKLLTLAEVADHLRLNVETVRRYVRSGKLRAVRLGGGRAGYRVPLEEVDKLSVHQETHRADESVIVRYGDDWPADPRERLARFDEMTRRLQAIPGNHDLPSIAVAAVREMRQEHG